MSKRVDVCVFIFITWYDWKHGHPLAWTLVSNISLQIYWPSYMFVCNIHLQFQIFILDLWSNLCIQDYTYPLLLGMQNLCVYLLSDKKCINAYTEKQYKNVGTMNMWFEQMGWTNSRVFGVFSIELSRTHFVIVCP